MEFRRDMAEVLRLRVQEREESYLSKRIEADQLAEQGWSSSERVTLTECNRADLAVSTYCELLRRAPGHMQIKRTLGDAMRLPPGLRPRRAFYLPPLCIEAKLAQAHESSARGAGDCTLKSYGAEGEGCLSGRSLASGQA
eukprot:234505-Pleurochrysis_carterae.AAC.1